MTPIELTAQPIDKGTQMNTTITINGIEYAPVTRAAGKRAVIVVDRGWIFAGDVTRENGRIHLSRAVHVFRWESIGFAKMIETEDADLRPIADVDMPEDAEIFCIPVHDKWGLMPEDAEIFCIPVHDKWGLK